MPARLIVYPPLRPTRVWSLTEGETYAIGRERATQETENHVDILVDDDRISRRHAVLDSSASGAWRLRDAGSKNGIELDGRAIDETELATDSWISLGGVLARFQVLQPGEVVAEQHARERRWRTSATLQRALRPSLGVEALLERLLDSVLELSDTNRGFVLSTSPTHTSVVDATTVDAMTVAAARGVSQGEVKERGFLGSSGVVREVLRDRRATACCDASAETWLGSRASVLSGGIRALVCLPLRADGRLLGVVYADSREPGASISDHDLEVLSALADHAALALSVAQIDREIDGLIEHLADGGALPGGEGSGHSAADLLTRLSTLRRSARAAG